ncbi:MAG: cell division topological specificity factor MinE [Candidatus Gastranaerophilales bacterium]|nr:cell division topological specificity factor MinE [Candidatus Gastranaerophilales bacterium]
MIEIFNDLYKKLAGFFRPEEKENVKEVACNRLKLVLMQDRTNLTPQLLERMRGELIDLLSKYVEMDREALELNFAQEGDSMALMLSIPVLRAKDEAEIQAIIDAEEEAKSKEQNAKGEAEEIEEDFVPEDEEISEAYEEEVEETDEDLTEEIEEEVCACGTPEESEEEE